MAATLILRQSVPNSTDSGAHVEVRHGRVRRESLGSERAAVASLRSQMELAQQAVRDEQLLAERLRQQASVASSSAQRRVRTSAPTSVLSWIPTLLHCHAFSRYGRRSARCAAGQQAVCAEAAKTPFYVHCLEGRREPWDMAVCAALCSCYLIKLLAGQN